MQCMAYLKKRPKEFTAKTEPWLVDLIMTLRRHDESIQGSTNMGQDSMDSQDTQVTPLAKAPTRRRSLFIRLSETSCPGEQEEKPEPKCLALCDKPDREHQDKVFLYNMLGNFATMIHKGDHIVSKVYTTNKDNHRIYVWPCGTTWTCTEGCLDGEVEEEEEQQE